MRRYPSTGIVFVVVIGVGAHLRIRGRVRRGIGRQKPFIRVLGEGVFERPSVPGRRRGGVKAEIFCVDRRTRPVLDDRQFQIAGRADAAGIVVIGVAYDINIGSVGGDFDRSEYMYRTDQSLPYFLPSVYRPEKDITTLPFSLVTLSSEENSPSLVSSVLMQIFFCALYIHFPIL